MTDYSRRGLPVAGATHTTILDDTATSGLGRLEIAHPPPGAPITPASRIALLAIGTGRHKLSGIGVDWGCGSGVLSIAAAKIASVDRVVGLDIAAKSVTIARHNAEVNGVSEKVSFFRADAFNAFDEPDRQRLASLTGRVNFILANPPSSEGDDGFGYRRRVLRDARPFLRDGGVVFLSISFQYGQSRIRHLSGDAPGYRHCGVLASTGWVPFDCGRPELLECLERYSEEEARGGMRYEFGGEVAHEETRSATAALAHFQETGKSPLTKWQQHLFLAEPLNSGGGTSTAGTRRRW